MAQLKLVRLGDKFKEVRILEDAVKLPAFNAKEEATDEGKHTAEFWAGSKKSSVPHFHAAKVANHWPNGAELHEDEFDQALEAAGNVKIR